MFLLPRGWVRKLLSLQVTFSFKTTLLGVFFPSPKKHRRNNVSFKPGSDTAVFIELELTASNAPQTTYFVHIFTILRKRKEEKDGVMGWKWYCLFSVLTTCSSNLVHAGFCDLPQQSQISPIYLCLCPEVLK